MNIVRTFLLALAAMLSFASVPVLVHAQASASKKAVCEGIGIAGGDCDSASTDNTVTKTIKAAIRIFQVIIGVIAVFTIITAGLTYITSGGDGSKTATAKNRIMYSAIGLVVVALSEVIVQFILRQVPN